MYEFSYIIDSILLKSMTNILIISSNNQYYNNFKYLWKINLLLCTYYY